MKEILTRDYIGKRVVATLIDYTVVWLFAFFYIWEVGEPNGKGGRTVSGWPTFGPMLFWFFYIVITERYLGGTLGHHLSKIKVISATAENLTLWRIFKRRMADCLEIAWCFGLIAYLLAMNTSRNQRLGDLLAQTLVVGINEQEHTIQFDFEG